jgi:hypothetical protein
MIGFIGLLDKARDCSLEFTTTTTNTTHIHTHTH